MKNYVDASKRIESIRQALINSGYFDPVFFEDGEKTVPAVGQAGATVEECLKAAKKAEELLAEAASFIHRHVVIQILEIERHIREPETFDQLRALMEELLIASEQFKDERVFVPVYGEILSVYILTIYRCASPGRESPIIQMILRNIARRKAIEIDQIRLQESLLALQNTVTVALIAKRYAVYVLATQGFNVVFRSEIEFRTFGTSPEALALQVTNLLLKHGIKLSEVTDVVCGGGDLGTVPDGIYVLTQRVRDESWKRLHNSSLNRGALVAWELKELLRRQGDRGKVNASVCGPLSFSTLRTHDMISLFRADSRELRQSLKGYVKVTPLKSIAALLSELQRINPEQLNLLVMSLDELFASVVRKTGPQIVRELAAQDANRSLIDFDFGKIVDSLKQENFSIPSSFRLASREIGTGVKEICELLMIVHSGKISSHLSNALMNVVETYAKQVAMILEMASAGKPQDRPHFIVITSMMALDPYFQELFTKIREMIDNPFTPIMCLDSLEHEYLIADQLFEMYVNPAKGDRRLHYSVELRSMKHAIQVLGSTVAGLEQFSFSALLDEVKDSISHGKFRPVNLVLVGADNEDALVAVANAKDYGLLDRIALIGDPREISDAVDRSRVPLSPNLDATVRIIPIDPLAVDYESKKHSMADVFRGFLHENSDYIVMKGSLDTAGILHEALSLYKPSPTEGSDKPAPKKLASHTALFVMPDGRFFALSDAAVNPGFRNSETLLCTIENQIDVIRKVVDARKMLKVAIITAVEKETAAIPSTLLAAETEERAGELENRYGPLIIEGPLSFDLATVPEVAEEKHYSGRIMGDANCLVGTDINTANVLYKMLSKTMGSLGLLVDNGGIITAGPGTVPIVLTSRGDTAQTKFNSILLALAYASRSQEDREELG
jgi:phosphate butyryltransferase